MSKERSVLLKSIYKGKPINSVAARVIGVDKAAKKTAIKSEASRIRRTAMKVADPDVKTALLIKSDRLIDSIGKTPEPKTSASAISKARRALDRAKWERENRRR